MDALALSAVIFVFVYGGALLGFRIRAALPEHHLSSESRSVVQVGAGLVGTMSALLLGLLTASAKSSYDVQNDEVKQTAANIVQLDRALADYGSETQEMRQALRRAIEERVVSWGRRPAVKPVSAGAPMSERLMRQVRSLVPRDDEQRAAQARALDLLGTIANTRWLLSEQRGSSISWPFLIVVVFWLTAIFTSFGLMSKPNGTIAITLLVCALSVSTAIFMILELDQPFAGLVHISSEPLADALEALGK